jgi:hypothetical protein
VFIPERSVTVAEPPRISMDETIIFVARLNNNNKRLEWMIGLHIEADVLTRKT